jgi:hypothetical protein
MVVLYCCYVFVCAPMKSRRVGKCNDGVMMVYDSIMMVLVICVCTHESEADREHEDEDWRQEGGPTYMYMSLVRWSYTLVHVIG